MTVRVGINRFGRIGRQVLKAIRDNYPNELEVVALNDIGDLKTMAHLLKYDSNYGRFDGRWKLTVMHLSLMAGRSVFSKRQIRRQFPGASSVWIVYAVEKVRYDLVLAGTRGLAQWEQFLVGSTAKRLIRKCPSSVWIVKAEHVGQPKVVMAATDFSDVSLKAATQGLWIAQQADAEFHLLHVVDSNDVPEDAICRIPKGSSLQQEINEEATKRMNAFLDSLSVDRARLQVQLAWGTPWKEIRRVAKYQGVDLVAMGTVGRSGIQGLFLGNTAEKVLDSCDCSILTVKLDGFVSPLAL